MRMRIVAFTRRVEPTHLWADNNFHPIYNNPKDTALTRGIARLVITSLLPSSKLYMVAAYKIRKL
jgi:L,D-peptidoglycan transpeptidase YkuD (ErfK/YbiS/YcfS/YnhG family)